MAAAPSLLHAARRAASVWPSKTDSTGSLPRAPSPMVCHAQGAAHSRPPAHTAWRTLKTADFAAALTAPAMAKSPHFALHHIAARPASASRPASSVVVPEISTAEAPHRHGAVDNMDPDGRLWLGLVVPKRHARHAVTRNLVKRQMRAQAAANHHGLAPGQWMIRLRAPIDARRFTSASSAQLQAAVRAELALVFARVARA